MLSHFDRIPERNRRTDRRTELLNTQYRASTVVLMRGKTDDEGQIKILIKE